MCTKWVLSKSILLRRISTMSGGQMGLSLNATKCELIGHQGVSVTDQRLQSFQRVEPKDTTLLGAPLFPGTILDQAWSDRCDDLSRAVKRLHQLGSQVVIQRPESSSPSTFLTVGLTFSTWSIRFAAEVSCPRHHQLGPVGHTMAASQFARQRRRLGG